MKYLRLFDNQEVALGQMVDTPLITTIKEHESTLFVPEQGMQVKIIQDTKDNTFINYFPRANGHEYVDLGLPSGKLWAKYNVGATSNENTTPTAATSGYLFQFGCTTPLIMGQDRCDWEHYPYNEGQQNFSVDLYNQYITEISDNNILKLSNDAAHVHMGGDWRTPTKEEVKELIDNTTCTFNNNSWDLKSKINGEVITFPQPFLWYSGGSYQYEYGKGYYWTSSIYSAGSANRITFYRSYTPDANNGFEFYTGFCIRAIIG